MNDLSLAELRLALTDLLTGSRKAPLDLTHASLIYRPRLQRLFDKLMALPPGVLELPLVELLQAADAKRDGYARALHHLRLAVLALPDAPDALRAAVVVVKDAFVPSLDVVRQPYAVAADSVTDDAKDLETHRATLSAVPTPDGRTLEAWVTGFVAAGGDIRGLLDERSGTLGSASSRAGAGALRGEILGTLYELRSVVATERGDRTDLPATIDGQIFGQLDELQRLAAARNAARAKPKPAAPTPVPGPAPAGDDA